MRINTNIMALNAYSNLENTSNNLNEQPGEALVGLPHQQGRRRRVGSGHQREPEVQVSGLQQATRNAQDGISVVQTAEGALLSVHSMLQRIHDLVIQSANTGASGLDRPPGRPERDRAAPRRNRPRRRTPRRSATRTCSTAASAPRPRALQVTTTVAATGLTVGNTGHRHVHARASTPARPRACR